MPLGPHQNYLVRYNGYQLPGYAQQESFTSSMTIGNHQAPFADGSLSEYTGLENKNLSITLKVWEKDYAACAEAVRQAATILRSNRSSFAPLYVQYTDRYYEALTPAIKKNKVAGTSVRLLEYSVDFECKPWLVSEATYTVSGVGVLASDSKYHMTINTDQVSRTISDGGWTPTTITVTGSDITISGYTVYEPFVGFVSVSGVVTNMIIDSTNVESTISGNNANDRMRWADYRTYVGPGKTSFDIIGASSCRIEYKNRWYI